MKESQGAVDPVRKRAMQSSVPRLLTGRAGLRGGAKWVRLPGKPASAQPVAVQGRIPMLEKVHTLARPA